MSKETATLTIIGANVKPFTLDSLCEYLADYMLDAAYDSFVEHESFQPTPDLVKLAISKYASGERLVFDNIMQVIAPSVKPLPNKAILSNPIISVRDTMQDKPARVANIVNSHMENRERERALEDSIITVQPIKVTVQEPVKKVEPVKLEIIDKPVLTKEERKRASRDRENAARREKRAKLREALASSSTNALVVEPVVKAKVVPSKKVAPVVSKEVVKKHAVRGPGGRFVKLT